MYKLLPTFTEAKTLTLLDQEEAFLKIKANPNDPVLFETFFCADCLCFVHRGTLTANQPFYHSGHYLAWLPALEEPTPGQKINLIAEWLKFAPLSRARREYLSPLAGQTTALSWAWVLTASEQPDWFDYLENYLAELADSWLMALNGSESRWLKSEQVWQTTCPPRQIFDWK